jgi:enamine deaminase RidA (YjgF/YER057c/UK114 family)
VTASRRSVASGSAWESRFGYHRAVAVGDHAWVSGTTAASSGAEPDADVTAQAEAAFAVALNALAALEFEVADVVRTRMYLIDRDDCEAVGGVHSRVFGETHPAASMVVVASLIAPELRVEIELEAFRGVRA